MYSYCLQCLQRMKVYERMMYKQTFEGAKVFADFGGNNARISLESPYLEFLFEITAR